MNLRYLITLLFLLVISCATVDCQKGRQRITFTASSKVNTRKPFTSTTATSRSGNRKYRTRSTTFQTNHGKNKISNSIHSSKLATVAPTRTGNRKYRTRSTIVATNHGNNKISNALHSSKFATIVSSSVGNRKYRTRSTTVATPKISLSFDPKQSNQVSASLISQKLSTLSAIRRFRTGTGKTITRQRMQFKKTSTLPTNTKIKSAVNLRPKNNA